MKRLLYIALLFLPTLAFSQTQFLGGPTTTIEVRGKLQADSLFFLPQRTDTTFTPGRAGALVYAYGHLYLYDSTKWGSVQMPQWGNITGSLADQTDLIDSLNARQSTLSAGLGIIIASNTVKVDTSTLRKVDTVYAVNDSTLDFEINSIVYQLELKGGAAGSGSVTSVGLSMPSIFTVTGTPVTTTGTLTASLNNQSSNTFLAGPSTGSATTPTFRLITTADLPTGIPNANLANSTINLSTGTNGSDVNVTNTPVALGGTMTLNIPTADSIKRGALKSGDWVNFNNKLDPGDTASLSSRINQIDVFIIGGQSNAEGQGDSTLSITPIPGTVLQYYGGLKQGKDPVGTATWGSAWPAFGSAYYAITGHKICFIPTSIGGSTQTVGADWYHALYDPNNWDTTGPWVPAAIDSFHRAISALQDSGYTPIVKGVLWAQGEGDGYGITIDSIDSTIYRVALQTMITRFKDSIDRRLPFYIFRSGYYTYHWEPGMKQVRAVQTNATNGDSSIYTIFYNAIDFAGRGMLQSDSTHYTQAGYNEMGRLGAQAVINSWSQNWQTQAGNVFFPLTNVGIGVDTPTAKLEIQGNADTALLKLKLSTDYTQATPIIQIVDSADTVLSESRFQHSIDGDGAPFVSMFIGTGAGANNTIGSVSYDGAHNTAFGYRSLALNTTGFYSTALGTYTLANQTTGSFNNAFGERALYNVTTGTDNTAVGQRSYYAITTGVQNVGVGNNTGDGNTGNNNTFIGFGAGYVASTGSSNVAIGLNAMRWTGNPSNRLAIAISNTTFPLVYGEFDNNILATPGDFGIGTKAPTARLMIVAGTATANTAPLKFTSGTNLTTPEAGAVEYDGTNFYATNSTATRYTLAKTLTNTATLDFGSTAAGSSTDLTITVTGAASGDAVAVGVPNGSTLSNGCFTGWVSAANTVTVRFTNNDLSSALDPASGTFRVSVLKY